MANFVDDPGRKKRNVVIGLVLAIGIAVAIVVSGLAGQVLEMANSDEEAAAAEE